MFTEREREREKRDKEIEWKCGCMLPVRDFFLPLILYQYLSTCDVQDVVCDVLGNDKTLDGPFSVSISIVYTDCDVSTIPPMICFCMQSFIVNKSTIQSRLHWLGSCAVISYYYYHIFILICFMPCTVILSLLHRQAMCHEKVWSTWLSG